ncbi:MULTISPECIES: PucR family transcriptional regulator [Citricoccus]|uniref:PucR family transcriptional regulator n=1 Tax=Citricoccus nitrophenolicus TaxID=863575 RepID=A0ABV0IKR3_9MICC|nr:PucR family transcriptional regulator [Citricoccus sp. I39-566]WMY78676.1 PucR family transcriptional regulator [Citricoccus sp. I39-566]
MPPGSTGPRPDEDEVHWPTVEQVLSWGELKLSLRTVDGHLGRRVRAVLTTEMVDNTAFLRGGELLLTTGMVWRSTEDGAAFVRAASRAGVAAIGFGTGPWSEVVPEALMTAARKSSMPVVEVPRSTPFMAIAERVGTDQARRRAEHTERVMIGSLMDHVRRGQADPAVLADHAPFLAAGNHCLAVACHAAEGGVPTPSRGLALVGWRDRRVLVVGEEAAVRHHVESRKISVYGWGGPAAAGSLRRLLGEAWSAFEVACQRGRPAAAKDLASVGGLLARLTPEQLSPFADHVLAPIQRYDAIHGTELLGTVEVFVQSRGSLAGASRLLYLHVNTVRQRMARVGALVGIDPLDPEGHLVLRLATHAAGSDVSHT